MPPGWGACAAGAKTITGISPLPHSSSAGAPQSRPTPLLAQPQGSNQEQEHNERERARGSRRERSGGVSAVRCRVCVAASHKCCRQKAKPLQSHGYGGPSLSRPLAPQHPAWPLPRGSRDGCPVAGRAAVMVFSCPGRRALALCPGHAGAGLPVLGVLLRAAGLHLRPHHRLPCRASRVHHHPGEGPRVLRALAARREESDCQERPTRVTLAPQRGPHELKE